MSKELKKRFYEEFPSLKGFVAFTDDESSMQEVLGALGKQSPVAYQEMLKAIKSCESRNCCLSAQINGTRYTIVNIVADFDFPATIKAPLLPYKDDQNLFTEFYAHHEMAHTVFFTLPQGKQSPVSANIFISIKEDDDNDLLAENFCDAYAALKIIQKYGDVGTKFIKRFADFRVLSALKTGSARHMTHNTLDAFAGMKADELTELALHVATLNGSNSYLAKTHLDEWQAAIARPSFFTFSKPSISRLFQAIRSEIDIPLERAERFVESVGFKSGDLKEAFMSSSLIKAFIGLEMTVGGHQNMKDVQKHIGQSIMLGDAYQAAYDNEFPGLREFIKGSVRTFSGGRFALLSAASSPEFTNDLAYKYLMRETILRLKDGPYVPYNIS